MIITHNGTILKHDGTILTKITEVPPQPPFTNTYSLDFDGVDDYINLGDSDDFSFGNGVTDSPFSISAWINMDDSSKFRIASKNTSTIKEYIFTTSGTKLLSFVLYDNSTGGRIQRKYNTALTSYEGQWINVTATYDGSSSSSGIKIYLNGTRVDDIDGNAGSYVAMEKTTQPFEIGRNDLTSFANGKIDEVSVFNSELSASDITDIYNSGTPTDLTSLSPIAWYRMGDNGSWKSPQWLLPNNENKDKVSNYSFEFDGNDDYIDIGNEINFEYNDAFSYSFWVNPNVVGGVNYLYSKYHSSGRGILIYYNSNGASTPAAISLGLFNTNGGSISTRKRITTATGNILTKGVWNNIVITYDGSGLGSGIKLYKNGVGQTVTVTQDNLQNSTILNSSNSYLGAFNGTGSFLAGKLDEFTIFNTELSSADALSIYGVGQPTDLTDLSPIAWYRMGEEANFTSNWLVDNSALSNYSKRSFYFDGTDQYLNSGALSTLANASSFSISLWVKRGTTAGNYRRVCGKYASASDNILIGVRPTTIFPRFYVTNGGVTSYVTANVGLTFNTWQNLVVVFDGSLTGNQNRAKIYLDGNNITATDVGTIPATTSADVTDFYFGKANGLGVFYWLGNQDEVGIFNYPLTPTQVTSVYNGGVPDDLMDTVGLTPPTNNYRMGEDASFNGTNWTVPDNVGTNDGTSVNMGVDDLVGEAPNYSGGGISSGMDIFSRVGEAPNSDNNALSINMKREDRIEDTP